MSDLTDFRTWTRLALMDSGAAIWSDDEIDAGLRSALSAYSQALPFTKEAVLDLPGDGEEIALDGLGELQSLLDVVFPYDTLAGPGSQPGDQVLSWRLWWDDARPVLSLRLSGGRLPRLGEQVRLWYCRSHTIGGLDGTGATSLPPAHQQALAEGAAAAAAFMRTLDLVELPGQDLYAVVALGAWARTQQASFERRLEELARRAAVSGPAQQSWQMDRWDAAGSRG